MVKKKKNSIQAFLSNFVKKLQSSMQLTNKKIFFQKTNLSHKKSIKYFY